MTQFRELTDNEKKLARRLIHSGVREGDQILKSALEGKVEDIQDDDSLFYGTPNLKSGIHNIAVEAEYEDMDGVLATISVHTIESTLSEIEIWKADGSRLTAPIDVDKVKVLWPAEKDKKGWWE